MLIVLLFLLFQPSKVTATPVMSAEDIKKRELASALFGGRGGMNREGMLSVSSLKLLHFHMNYYTYMPLCNFLSNFPNITFTSNRTIS